MKNYLPERMFIYPKDVKGLTDKSLQWAQRELRKVRRKFNKPTRADVTIAEYAAFKEVPEEYIRQCLKLRIRL